VQVADNFVVQHQIEPGGIALILFRSFIQLLEHHPPHLPATGKQRRRIRRVGSNAFHLAGIASGIASTTPVAVGQ